MQPSASHSSFTKRPVLILFVIPSIRQNASVWGFEYAGGWGSFSSTFCFGERDGGGGAVGANVSTSLIGSARDGSLSSQTRFNTGFLFFKIFWENSYILCKFSTTHCKASETALRASFSSGNGSWEYRVEKYSLNARVMASHSGSNSSTRGALAELDVESIGMSIT